jgi:hypothetical protein
LPAFADWPTEFHANAGAGKWVAPIAGGSRRFRLYDAAFHSTFAVAG